jgi:hypothetical protein
MNLPTIVVITGCESPAILQQALEAARSFKARGKDEVAQLLARTAPAADKGRFRTLQDDSPLRRNLPTLTVVRLKGMIASSIERTTVNR